jgi:hypothetical protein
MYIERRAVRLFEGGRNGAKVIASRRRDFCGLPKNETDGERGEKKCARRWKEPLLVSARPAHLIMTAGEK